MYSTSGKKKRATTGSKHHNRSTQKSSTGKKRKSTSQKSKPALRAASPESRASPCKPTNQEYISIADNCIGQGQISIFNNKDYSPEQPAFTNSSRSPTPHIRVPSAQGSHSNQGVGIRNFSHTPAFAESTASHCFKHG